MKNDLETAEKREGNNRREKQIRKKSNRLKYRDKREKEKKRQKKGEWTIKRETGKERNINRPYAREKKYKQTVYSRQCKSQRKLNYQNKKVYVQ